MENIDLGTLESVRDNLIEQVDKLKIQHSNLEAQIRQKTIASEGKGKLDEVERLNKVHQDEERLRVGEDRIEEKKKDLQRLEEMFKDRMMMLEKREQATLDLEKIRMALIQERTNFNKYKYDTELELEKAKVIIEEAKLAMQAVDSEKSNFKAREKELLRKEKYYNDVIGKLEQDKKDFEIYRQNVLGQEVSNVSIN